MLKKYNLAFSDSLPYFNQNIKFYLHTNKALYQYRTLIKISMIMYMKYLKLLVLFQAKFSVNRISASQTVIECEGIGLQNKNF